MKEIPMHSGHVALVDDEDYDMLTSQGAWRTQRSLHTSYAKRSGHGKNGRSAEYMHRVIMKAGPGVKVDHIDGDGLNNQKSNLRICTSSQNSANRRSKPKHNTSGYMGVYWNKRAKRWMAYISINNKMKYLGYYEDPVEAAMVRDEKALELFGEFATLNFPT